MEEPAVEEILNRKIITTNPLRKALVREFRSKYTSADRVSVEKFSNEAWEKYPKLQAVYKEKDNLLDILMDEFRITYE